MGLFKSKYEKYLDYLLEKVQMNMSNNYKDAAQEDMAEFEKVFEELIDEGSLKDKEIQAINVKAAPLREKLKGYTHKDQKPFWTKEEE